jgi:hypothetical protein
MIFSCHNINLCLLQVSQTRNPTHTCHRSCVCNSSDVPRDSRHALRFGTQNVPCKCPILTCTTKCNRFWDEHWSGWDPYKLEVDSPNKIPQDGHIRRPWQLELEIGGEFCECACKAKENNEACSESNKIPGLPPTGQ